MSDIDDVLQRIADSKSEGVPKHLLLELCQAQENEYHGIANRNYEQLKKLQGSLRRFRKQLVSLLLGFFVCMAILSIAALITNNQVKNENTRLQQQQAQIQHSRYLAAYNTCQTDKAKRAAFVRLLSRDFPTQVGDQNFVQLVSLISTVVPDRGNCRAYARAQTRLPG